MRRPVSKTAAWKALARHARQGAPQLAELFATDPARAERYSRELGELYLDFSKQQVSDQTLALLFDLARQVDLPGWIERMYAGEPINNTEGRAVLHVALRSDSDEFPVGRSVMPDVREARARMQEFATRVRSGQLPGATGKPVRDVVNLGIGGSDLGPRMVVRALQRCAPPGPRAHFVANVDPADLDVALRTLDPETTLFIVASKTFTTAETLDNARRARAWLAPIARDPEALSRHFAAVSANVEAACAFGVDRDQVFPFWDWVGGRFSVWSSVGLAAALALGYESFASLAEGARKMDAHFQAAPLESNLPVVLALLSVWNINFLGARGHAILPYSEDLRELPGYLQQLEMESNGKRVDRNGVEVDYATAPVIWGASGTTSQHSFHQLLHQGTGFIPVDFIVPAKGAGDAKAHAMLVENALAQASALMTGTSAGEPPHAHCPGNRPSTTLLMERLTPATLGQLIALYEHKVFVQGVLWNINSFDQWGVELGKKIARALAAGQAAPPDPSTAALLARARRA
ncbi:MAG: glucose-6-phosphate isomerase [Betaproteobacteria bacterium RIFCSPLOWO2_02_FULL_65_24]|nr:MAG: glucose-6-phosphate isomerase [Betaproteobacteria bacterium RIFCSPLOWO2_02_FULL_65_24]